MLPEPDFTLLEARLLDAGIAPRHVRRTVTELREHFDDLVGTELANRRGENEARALAAQDLGNLDAVVAAMRARPELLSWPRRFPRTAVLLYPLTCLALLPVAPVIAGVAHAPLIARWSVSLMFGALVTASIFLLLQLSILLA